MRVGGVHVIRASEKELKIKVNDRVQEKGKENESPGVDLDRLSVGRDSVEMPNAMLFLDKFCRRRH